MLPADDLEDVWADAENEVDEFSGFADPAVEHRLWIPDQILGAYAESVTSPGLPKAWESEWEALRGTVTTIDVPL